MIQLVANWLDRLRHRNTLAPDLAARLAAWQARPKAALDLPHEMARYVVLDVESTGLDMRRDRLIAIGAVAITGGRIDLADSFEIVLRQDTVSTKANILVHGIGGERQREGVEPAEALLRFLDYLGNSPIVAFHVAFDRSMIRRACKTYLGLDFRHAWLDLAYALPALLPELTRTHRSLDDWAQRFGITNHARHNALADALVTGQLLLATLSLAREQHISHYAGLQGLEQAQLWLSRTHSPAL